jgi:hypothetical protein
MRCPICQSKMVKGRCAACVPVERRRVHTMLPPGKERRTNKPTSGWDNVVIPGERRW